MNIALPALVVFLILLPGFIARTQIKLAESEKLDYSPFGKVVAEGLLWAALLHVLWLGICAWWERYLDMGVLLGLLSSVPTLQANAIERIRVEARWIAEYFVSQLLISALLARFIRVAIARYRLDRASSRLAWLLRFRRAPWYYLLSGADFARNEIPDMVSISAVLEVSGRAVLHVGSLAGYQLDPEGRLDWLVLEAARKRPLAENVAPGRGRIVRRYHVQGDYFVVRYDRIISLNVRYLRLAGTPAPSMMRASTRARRSPGATSGIALAS